MIIEAESELKAQPENKRRQKVYWKEIKGSLYARLQYKDEVGKWREKLKPITDKRTASSVVREMRQELEQHGEETLKSDKLTFRELAKKYEETKLVPATYSNGVKIAGKRSLAPVKSALKPLIEHFAHKTVRSIKKSDLELYQSKRLKTDVEKEVNVRVEKTDENGKKKTTWKKEKRTRPRKIATVNRELALLRTMLNFAIENDWLPKNPFQKAKSIISLSAEVERDRVLSFSEEARLLSFCIDQRAHLRPLLICALDTGMRRGEMFKMCWRDVNLTTGEIYIPQTNTKTEDARTVGITPRLKCELLVMWEASPQQQNGSVFGIGSTIKTAWKTVCDKADITDFRLHDCRHTATTRMIASGSPHTEVMKITGHTQLKTFLRYLNITPETARNVASKLDSYVTAAKTVDVNISETIN